MANFDQVLTANRLRDGEVVYWASGQWITGLSGAEIFEEKAPAEAALEAAGQAVKARIVVNPYLFAVIV